MLKRGLANTNRSHKQIRGLHNNNIWRQESKHSACTGSHCLLITTRCKARYVACYVAQPIACHTPHQYLPNTARHCFSCMARCVHPHATRCLPLPQALNLRVHLLRPRLGSKGNNSKGNNSGQRLPLLVLYFPKQTHVCHVVETTSAMRTERSNGN